MRHHGVRLAAAAVARDCGFSMMEAPATWVCGYAAAPDKMTVKGTNNTSVPARNLPLKCRPG